MTATRRGLAILTALVVVLAAVHVLAGDRRRGAIRAPFADAFDPATVKTITWERPDAARVAIERARAGWVMTAPAPGPVDRALVDDALAALRQARAQRRAAADRAPARVVVTVDGKRFELTTEIRGVGAWIRHGGESYLVDPWVAAALDRDPLELRMRTPIPIAPSRITGVTVTAPDLVATLAGPPLAIDRAEGKVVLRPELANALTEALASLRAEALVTRAPPDAAPILTLVVSAGPGVEPVELVGRGQCPTDPARLWVGGAAGEVCIDADPLQRFEHAIRIAVVAPLEVADPRPLDAPFTEVRLASGERLQWRGAAVELVAAGGAAGAEPADDAAARRVADALLQPAIPTRVASPRPPARGTIEVTTAAGVEPIDLIDVRGRVALLRKGSAIAHVLAPAAAAALRQDATALRDRLLWRTEPSLVTAMTSADAGAAPRPIEDPARRQAIAEALAAPRAVRVLDPKARVVARHVLEITYAPPPTAGAEPEIHRLEVGGPTAGGCQALADGRPVVLPPALCRLVR